MLSVTAAFACPSSSQTSPMRSPAYSVRNTPSPVSFFSARQAAVRVHCCAGVRMVISARRSCGFFSARGGNGAHSPRSAASLKTARKRQQSVLTYAAESPQPLLRFPSRSFCSRSALSRTGAFALPFYQIRGIFSGKRGERGVDNSVKL